MNLRHFLAKALTNVLVPAITVFSLSAPASTEEQLIAGSDPESEHSVVDSTGWSRPVNNVSMQVSYTPVEAYADPIELQLRLRASFSDSTQQLSRRLPSSLSGDSSHITLRLTNLRTGLNIQHIQASPTKSTVSATHAAEPVFLTHGEIWSRSLSYKVDYEPREIDHVRSSDTAYIWRAPRKVFVHESLPVGTYSACVEIFIPESEPDVWHGLLTSPPFPITVSGSAYRPQEQVFLFPRKLRLSKGPVIDWDPDDLDTVRILTASSNLLHYRIKSDFGNHHALGLPECPVIVLKPDLTRSFVQTQLSLKPRRRVLFVDGRMELSFHFELSESIYTPEAERHRRGSPVPYKLWETDLEISITKTQYDSLIVTDSEVYDHHTIIVPRHLRRGLEGDLRFGIDDATIHDVRFLKGYKVFTGMSFLGDSVIWGDGPPRLPVFSTAPAVPNSTSSFRIKVCAVCPVDTENTDSRFADTVLLWTGLAEKTNIGPDYVVTEEFTQPVPEFWPMRTHYIPRQLRLTNDLKLTADPTDSIEIALPRAPATALLADLVSDSYYTRLSPDLGDISIPLRSARVRNDTLVCRLDLYEMPAGSSVTGSRDILWRHKYKIPLSDKLAKKLHKHIEKRR